MLISSDTHTRQKNVRLTPEIRVQTNLEKSLYCLVSDKYITSFGDTS